MDKIYVGVDTGGTFTDIVALSDDGVLAFEKAFSTPGNPEQGVLNALEHLGNAMGLSVDEILARTVRFAYGTTVATNALIQRRGARVGLLVTKGFEDTLAIARGALGRTGGLAHREAMDYIHTERPDPLVPKARIRGIAGRIAVDGSEIVPLDPRQVAQSVAELVEEGIDSLAVCLLWSFKSDHEQAVLDVVRRDRPDLPISCSSEISPQMGEFERTMTAVVSAYVRPIVEKHTVALQRHLSEHGLKTPIQVISSSGGLIVAEQVGQHAVSIINSGPIGGLVAARHVGDLLGKGNIITTDMGGTSFDVGLIVNGEFEREERPFIDQGIPVQVPALKVVTIGAGGGSIAWTDGHRLQVGPQSAGAVPGPACYGLGGESPTVTDALVVMGIIDPDNFFGGRRQLHRELAERAIFDHIAGPLGLDPVEAAAGIFEIVSAKMSDLVRKVTIESGYDPRDFTLLSYGGAGPAHCWRFANSLGVREVVVPYTGSVFSAFGAMTSDVRFSCARSEPLIVDGPTLAAAFPTVFEALKSQARANVTACGYEWEGVRCSATVDVRYVGQMNEVAIPWDEVGDLDDVELKRRFEAAYVRKFGRESLRDGLPLEVITFRMDVVVPTDKPNLERGEAPDDPDPEEPVVAATGTRNVYLRGDGWLQAQVFGARQLVPGSRMRGPCVIERPDTTVLIPPGATASVDRLRNIAITAGDEPIDGH